METVLGHLVSKLFPRTPPFASNVIYQLQRMNENSNVPLRVKRSKKAPQKIKTKSSRGIQSAKLFSRRIGYDTEIPHFTFFA